MKDQLSYEELQKQIADLKQKNATLERGIKEAKSEQEIKARIVDVFRSTPLMMAISNLSDGKYVEVNENFLKTLGYKRNDIIGKSSDDIDLFADIVQSDKFINKLSRLKKVRDFDVTLKTKKGEEKEFKFSAESIFIGDDKFLLTSYTDAKDTDHSSSEEVNKTFQRLRVLFESLTNFVMIVVPDDKGKYVIEYVNKEAREFNNLDVEKLPGKNLSELDILNREVLVELIGKIIISGLPAKQTILDNEKEDEGYYYGVKLNTGEIVIIWEAGAIESSRKQNLLMQGGVFERFADMIPNTVFEINTRGMVTYANLTGLDKFGYTKKQLEKGISIRDIFHEDDIKRVMENLKGIKKSGDRISNEYTAIKSNKEEMLVFSQTSGIYDRSGKLLGYRGILTDMTEKKKIQDEILREKIHLETLIESAPESIVQTTQDGTIERINEEFTREFGFTEEDCIGNNIDDLIIPDTLEDEGSAYTKRASMNEKIEVETYRKTKSGENIFVSVLIKPVSFKDETTSLFAIYRNITDKRKDRELKDVILNISNAALSQTEFHDMFSNFQNEIGKIWDTKNFYIALYNDENKTLSLPFYSDEKDRFDNIPTKGTLTGWLISQKKAKLLDLNEIAVLEKKGEIDLVGTPCKVWLGVPLKVDGQIIGAMVLQDYDDVKAFNDDDLRLLKLIGNQIALVIQRKDMMSNLIIERAKAEDAARLKAQFMSTMSHEIRTPLNEVIGITNLLLQGNPRSDQMEFIKTLRFSGNHLLTLVNDVLDFNKMESGMIVFEKTQFNLTDFINDLRRTYSFRTDEKGLEFKVVKSSELPEEIIGDPIRLNQMLSNLISNSVKFTKKGFVELSVKELKRDKKSIDLEFSVTDTGIGIPADKHEAIFESYTQASEDTTRIFGGTGLGLSIVKKLIELQGSTIKVESDSGKGSRFSFTLTFAIGKTFDKPSSKGEADEENLNQLEGKNILIAEDNKINFFVANKFLTKWGVVVSHAENGKIAIDMILENDYDLILMDLHMPEMDGIEATQIIRESKHKKINELPVIALTAAIMSEHEDKIDGLNINDYILKPFKPKELYDKILQHSK